MEAAREHGVNIIEKKLAYYEDIFHLGQFAPLLHGPQRHFTAAACIVDQMAINLWEVIEDNGLRVPDDVSIIGFDDNFLGSRLIRPLTTIRHPYRRMVIRLGEWFQAVIERKSSELKEKVKPLLMARQSVRNLN
jgi:DNA-binding LacI/PurR family transcriptional regulator